MSFESDAGAADLLSDVLFELGAVSITTTDANATPGQPGSSQLLEPKPGEQPLWLKCRNQALFTVEQNMSTTRAAFEHASQAANAPFTGLLVDQIEDEDWINAWRIHATTECFGERLWVAPKDADLGAAVPAAQVLRLEPGLAFGSGSHPTTNLCLQWLARQNVNGLAVLDYGCGSGILALASVLLGAQSAVAVDYDPQALVSSRENADYNGLSRSQVIVQFPEDFVRGDTHFDCVLANILANPLCELAQTLQDVLNPGGQIALSGILESQAVAVMDNYQAIQFDTPAVREGWVCLSGTKRS